MDRDGTEDDGSAEGDLQRKTLAEDKEDPDRPEDGFRYEQESHFRSWQIILVFAAAMRTAIRMVAALPLLGQMPSASASPEAGLAAEPERPREG